MIFCRYIGVGDKPFTNGKVYPATPEVNGAEAVGFDFIEIVDDDGHKDRYRPEEGCFEFLEEIYVVVTGEVKGREVGEVVVATDMPPDGEFISIKGVGLLSASSFSFLDGTNVFPGMMVMDALTGFWVPIRRVDECLWIMVNGGKEMRSPKEFRFAVADHEILTEPVARCIDDMGYPNLTLNRLYRIQKSWEELWTVTGDDGKPLDCLAGRFRMGS